MIKTYADIIVDITSEKLDRSFQYLVPQHLEGRLQPGMQVQVPFGNGGRMIKGYVIRVTDQPSFDVSRMKEIRGVETGSNSIESRLIALAAWMREQYGATMIQALKTVLPVKQKMKQKEVCCSKKTKQKISWNCAVKNIMWPGRDFSRH